MLTHSRFTSKHRAEKEADLVSQLGKGAHRGDVRPERLIVVGTQVIEQSLDLDFDVMVTDFAPVDLVPGFYEVQLVDYLLRYSPELGLEAIQISND